MLNPCYINAKLYNKKGASHSLHLPWSSYEITAQ